MAKGTTSSLPTTSVDIAYEAATATSSIANDDDVVFHRNWRAQRSLVILAVAICAASIMLAPAYSLTLGTAVDLKPTDYSNYTKTFSYKSDPSYSPKGMGELYNKTHDVIEFFIGTEPVPEGYIRLSNKTFTFDEKVHRNEWWDLIKSYWGLILIVILFVLIAVLFPIVGICICFCRCAGLCGGRAEPRDRKYDTCRRVLLGLLLLILVVALLFGVIVVFTTNIYLQSGLMSSTRTVRAGSSDVRLFLSNTGQEINHVLVKNYNELVEHLGDILKDASQHLITNLEVKSSTGSLISLSELLSKLPSIRDDLIVMKRLTNDLRVLASQLSDGLRGVKREILLDVIKCDRDIITNVLKQYEVHLIDNITIYYDSLPDVTGLINQLDELINNNITTAAERGIKSVEQIRTDLSSTVNKHTPDILAAIKDSGKKFVKVSNEINLELENIGGNVEEQTEEVTEKAENYLGQYGPYRFYGGVFVSAALLLILCCLMVALCCGICGKRRGGYGDDCCNKGTGARLLMVAVILIFLTASLIAFVALIHFLFGVVTYRGVCIPLRKLRQDSLFQTYDDSIDLNDHIYSPAVRARLGDGPTKPLRISDVVLACKDNATIYEVLNLGDRIDIRSIKDHTYQNDINKTLSDFVDSITFSGKFQIFNDDEVKRISSLIETGLADFDISRYQDNLNDKITKYSLTEISDKFNDVSSLINRGENGRAPEPACKLAMTVLRNQALHLRAYQFNLVDPIIEATKKLMALATKVEASLKYKNQPFRDSIPAMIKDINDMQDFINSQGLPYVKEVASNLTNYLSKEISDYMDMVIESVEHRIGVCSPLSNVYASSVVGACNRIVDPMNTFWAAVLFCLLLLIPILFVSIKLAKLYKKTDPYPGPLVEAEYLYDAYSERDHIPMTNGPKNKRRKNKDRRRRNGGGAVGGVVAGAEYYEDALVSTSHGVPPVAAGGVRDTRYNDMAPKHWDGGPPRYQNPPIAPPASEYERPPPYYYPGAVEQD